ncbi:MAG: DUF262 domain-containing protein [Alphaproteobacteria bacterium]
MAKAKDKNFLEDIIGKPSYTYYIPAFQRSYAWDKENCEDLWEDIERIIDNQEDGDDEFTHYLGDIVTKVQIHAGQLTLIDGQQRITTILLLILAMMEVFPEEEQELYEKYIENKAARDRTLRIKLKSINQDHEHLKKILERIVDKKNAVLDKDSRLIKNYIYFKRTLDKKLKKDEDFDYNQLINALKKLVIVHVELATYDNPHIIFEKLNSAGEPLSKPDLIRNFLLMQVNDDAKQEYLYKHYWKIIEHNTYNKKDKKSIENFFRYYLVTKTHKAINEAELYKDFKSYYKKEWKDKLEDCLEDCLKDITTYSDYFYQIINKNTDNPAVNRALQFFLDIKITIFYPVLLQVFDYWQDKKTITPEDVIAIIEELENFLFIRMLYLGSPTAGLNKLVLFIIGNIEDNINRSSYLNILLYYLHDPNNYYNYHINYKDASSLAEVIKNYHFQGFERLRPLLNKLEYDLQLKKEFVDVNNNNISTEHILPQKIPVGSQWEKDFGKNEGDDHIEYCYKLGNMTLTGYNSEYSNNEFSEKKSCENGFDKSPLALNSFLKQCDKWTKQEIDKRTAELAEKLAKLIFPRESNYSPKIILKTKTLDENEDEDEDE